MCSLRSASGIRAISVLPPTPPNRHSVTPVACSENSEKFTPLPSGVAPSGYGVPGRISDLGFAIWKVTLMASREDSGNRGDLTGHSRYYFTNAPRRFLFRFLQHQQLLRCIPPARDLRTQRRARELDAGAFRRAVPRHRLRHDGDDAAQGSLPVARSRALCGPD